MLARLIGALFGIDGLGRQSTPLDDQLCDWAGGSPAKWSSAISAGRTARQLPRPR